MTPSSSAPDAAAGFLVGWETKGIGATNAMFDFEKWRNWLAVVTKDLQDAGFATEWKSNDEYLRSTTLNASGLGRIASFHSFENGLVDYEIMDTTGFWIANEAMIEVDDQNFEEVFRKFSGLLRDPAARAAVVAEGKAK